MHTCIIHVYCFTQYNEYVIYDVYLHEYIYIYTGVMKRMRSKNTHWICWDLPRLPRQWGWSQHLQTAPAKGSFDVQKLRYIILRYTDLVLRCFNLKNKARQTSAGRGVTCISQIGSLAAHTGVSWMWRAGWEWVGGWGGWYKDAVGVLVFCAQMESIRIYFCSSI